MTPRRKQRAFADEVRDLAANPSAPRTPLSPRLDLSADSFRGPHGVIWQRVGDVLDPVVARDMIRAGALVAWDPCGCGGDCGLTWLDDVVRGRLAAALPDVRPSKRYSGAITSWRDKDGHELLVVQWPVQWRDELS
jgi:hypothetical protein